jgi:Terminase large subunit, T4likevirus-type, N-terminal
MAARVQIRFVPQPAQRAYIDSPADITVFGGARGGGKTFASLGDFWLHAEDHGADARGLMVRKTRADLKDTIHTAITLYGNAASFREHGQFFDFRNGARLYMAFLENERDAMAYQGWSLTRCYLEEITQFSSLDPMLKLLATLRSSAGIRCQMKATCNPGGPGHFLVKQMFIDNGPFNLVRDPETNVSRVFIPARVKDNPALTDADPGYVNRLRAVGTPQLVRAWLEGDWDVVEGSFFPEFDRARHVIPPFPVPNEWIKFRSMDWGSAKPFCVSWFAVVQDGFEHDGRFLPRSSIVNYREYYGMKPGQPDVGLKMTAEEVAREIVARETDDHSRREYIAYGVLDPAAFAVISGPSIAETLIRNKVLFRRADNQRVARDKRMGGHDQVRNRLKGDLDGHAMLFFMSHCKAITRTLPTLVHDPVNPEDLDTDSEDHAYDALRYGCMSRPFLMRDDRRDRNPYLIKNLFRLDELR